MPSNTYLPTLEQGALLTFENNWKELAQQRVSKLANSPAVVYLPSNGKYHNVGRIGSMELSEVSGRNPEKQFSDYAIDDRQLRKRRFTRSILIDKLYDVNELISDPTGLLMQSLTYAKNRTLDRVIAAAAIGSVSVGAPNAATSTITAATDGVITVDATAGLTYEKIQEITQNFINNDLDYEDFRGTMLCITGSENTDLMAEVEFINNDYISSRPVEAGVISNAGVYGVTLFAGSVNGGITVSNPVLDETGSSGTVRACLALAPNSIAVSMELGRLNISESATHVNSWELTIDLWVNAMRIEGVRVQKINTTI